jgi:hypothetical protein
MIRAFVVWMLACRSDSCYTLTSVPVLRSKVEWV